MIKHVIIRNFKAWKELDIRLGSMLTVLFGANSSGKSSLIHFLLMLQETKNNTDRNLVLDFGGDSRKINLGSFSDVCHKFDRDNNNSMEWTIEWQAKKPVVVTDPLQSATKIVAKSKDLTVTVRVAEAKKLQTQSLAYTVGDVSFSIERTETKRAETKYKLQSSSNFKLVRARGRVWNLPSPLKTHLFPDEVKTYYQNGNALRDIEFAYENELMDTIYYLGPLRDYPHRDYSWDGASPSDVGTRGELTINALLAAGRDNKTLLIKRGKRNYKQPFQVGIASRLKKMGLIESFSVEKIAENRDIYEVRIKYTKDSQSVLLTDVGFGVSQVLPVVVLLNYVPEKSVVILEQPELHLHPRVQTHLADTIMSIAEVRQLQVIVESHSEHFLRRIQRRVAENEGLNDKINLYSVAQKKGEAQLNDLKLNSFGEIENWPDNFFGDEMGEIIAITEAKVNRKTGRQ